MGAGGRPRGVAPTRYGRSGGVDGNQADVLVEIGGPFRVIGIGEQYAQTCWSLRRFRFEVGEVWLGVASQSRG